MDISLSNKKYLQERKSATILGWLSDIGGLNDALCLILAPMIAFVSSTSFSYSLTNGMPTDTGSPQGSQSARHEDIVFQKQSHDLLKRIEISDRLKLDKLDVMTLLNHFIQLKW